MVLITALVFIVIFSLLVLVHEWGHFKAARHAGVKVEEFGIGLPPRAKTLYTDKQGTVYSLNWIPFGGYVRLYGEDSTDPKILRDKKSFASKSIVARTLIILAGVGMNFVLAWVLITFGFSVGMKPFLATENDLKKGIESGVVVTESVLYVYETLAGSPAEGLLQPEDRIMAINGQPVPDAQEFSASLEANTPYTLAVARGQDAPREIILTSNAEGQMGVTISTEIQITDIKEVRYPLYIAPVKAVQEIGRLSVLTVKLLGNVIVSLVSKLTVPDGVAGPVGIAQMTHRFVQEGFMALVQFAALLSISLGVINVMPFPALDGGRFLFIIFEIILRRRPSAKWESIIHATGFALLMLLILAITWNDILRIMKP